jgi:hypothetical protein
MRPTDIWPKTARIIEVGATCDALGRRLIAAGYEKYLAVTANQRRCQIIKDQQPVLRRRTVTAHSRRVVSQNNADVLVLSGWSVFALGRFRSIRHAKYVAIKFHLMPLCWLTMLLAAMHCALFRLRLPRFVNFGVGGSGPWLLAFRVRKPRPYNGVRRFIPHELGVCGLLYGLQTAGVRHAVLRWFETLPQVAGDEDLDLLVDDAALEQLRKTLDDGPGIQPVDLYSVTGLPGADFRNMPYFPPYLAEELLDRSVIYRGLCRVPAPREHFLSMAYHALYHKGRESGIQSKNDRRRRRTATDHDYVSVISRLAQDLGISVEMTLEGLDDCLDAHGWRPPHDMLIRLSRRNRWVRSLLKQPHGATNVDDRIAVFLLREEGLRRGGVDRAVQLIEQRGFQIVETHLFDERKTVTIARSLRGGNWGRGPWPISGGPPVAAIVTYDPAPITPSRRDKKRFPFIANARLLCKEQIRDAFNDGVASDQHCNVIHSSDNGREALDYLRIIMPDGVDTVSSGVVSRPAARAA